MPLYSTANLNLDCSLVFSSILSFCTFWKKVPKNMGSRVRHSVLKVDNIAFSHPVRCNNSPSVYRGSTAKPGGSLALRTTICCQCCRFAEQIQELPCNIFQSVHTSPLVACRNAWGGKNSLCSNIMPPVSAHCSAARCASQRSPSAVGGELPLQWETSRTLARAMLISNRNRHR